MTTIDDGYHTLKNRNQLPKVKIKQNNTFLNLLCLTWSSSHISSQKKTILSHIKRLKRLIRCHSKKLTFGLCWSVGSENGRAVISYSWPGQSRACGARSGPRVPPVQATDKLSPQTNIRPTIDKIQQNASVKHSITNDTYSFPVHFKSAQLCWNRNSTQRM